MEQWMNDPVFQKMEPAKKQLIQMAANQTAGKKNHDMAPVLFALIQSANKQGIKFTQEEFTCVMEALKQGKTKKEQDHIDQTINMVRSLLKI